LERGQRRTNIVRGSRCAERIAFQPFRRRPLQVPVTTKICRLAPPPTEWPRPAAGLPSGRSGVRPHPLRRRGASAATRGNPPGSAARR
jgi:hypothetical protein